MISHVDAVVLAGGQDPPEPERIAALVATLETCVERVEVASGATADDLDPAAAAPMIGLRDALSRCRGDAVLVVGGNRSDLDADTVLALLALVPTSGAEIIAPRTPEGPDPLFAVYRASLRDAVDRKIAAGELSIRALISEREALLVPADALRDPAGGVDQSRRSG